ncbi:hypothetical protein [Allohahella marinimesophila]|uniref:SpoVT-AbrB domain-containing protein n=1 Tax=Allohahella marinimesophila TaxID=1054972 RepID=A0ABP7Q862_9GAMM
MAEDTSTGEIEIGDDWDITLPDGLVEVLGVEGGDKIEWTLNELLQVSIRPARCPIRLHLDPHVVGILVEQAAEKYPEHRLDCAVARLIEDKCKFNF